MSDGGLGRRAFLGGLASGLLATGGCLGVVAGDQPLAFASDPAVVGDDALSETGYELAARQSPALSREVTVAGQTREVTVTNHAAVYERSIDLGPLGRRKAAGFALVTTPRIEVAGRAFNPVGELSTERLLREFGSRLGGLTVGERAGADSVTALGAGVTVEKYVGTATVEGREMEVSVHAARFEHGGDYVIAAGAYPRHLDGEAENVLALVTGIEH